MVSCHRVLSSLWLLFKYLLKKLAEFVLGQEPTVTCKVAILAEKAPIKQQPSVCVVLGNPMVIIWL